MGHAKAWVPDYANGIASTAPRQFLLEVKKVMLGFLRRTCIPSLRRRLGFKLRLGTAALDF